MYHHSRRARQAGICDTSEVSIVDEDVCLSNLWVWRKEPQERWTHPFEIPVKGPNS